MGFFPGATVPSTGAMPWPSPWPLLLPRRRAPPPCRKWTWRPPSAALLPSSFPPAPSPLLPSGNPRVELLPPHPVDAPSGDTGHPEADRSRRRLRLAELQLPDAGISAGKPHIAVPTRSFPASGRHVGHRFVAVVPPRASPSALSPLG